MENYDDWHYSFASLDGYDCALNFALSCRGTGKTTAFWKKSWGRFRKDGSLTIVQTRNQCDITDIFIESINASIAKFSDCPVFKYAKKGMAKEGMCDVYAGGRRYLRILAMSTPLKKLKNMFLSNVAFWWADEFVCNERIGERYVKGEAFKFKEAWTTFYRESPKMKCYLSGNPYSAYNPYFSEFGIDPSKIELGKIVASPDKQWAVERYLPNDALLASLRKNPIYAKETDEYTRYALLGQSVNDQNIFLIPIRPIGFSLRYYFKIEGKLVSVWENNDFLTSPRFWVGEEERFGNTRDVYCFDFKDLSERVVFFSHDERNKMGSFRMAVRNRDVAFQSIECNYFIEEIYQTL